MEEVVPKLEVYIHLIYYKLLHYQVALSGDFTMPNHYYSLPLPFLLKSE